MSDQPRYEEPRDSAIPTQVTEVSTPFLSLSDPKLRETWAAAFRPGPLTENPAVRGILDGFELKDQARNLQFTQSGRGDLVGIGDKSTPGLKVEKIAGQERVTEVEYSNGREVRRYGYDANGQLNRIDHSGHDSLVLKNGKWINERTGEDVGIRNPQVGRDGTFKYERADGSGRFTQFRNGTGIEIDNDNRVVRAFDAKGQIRTFEYGADGRLSGGINPDGSRFTIVDGKQIDDRGNQTGISNLEVKPDGTVSYTNRRGEKISQKLDGSSIIEKPDKSKVTKDSEDRITKIERPDGKSVEFSYDGQGNLVRLKGSDGKVYESELDAQNQHTGKLKSKDGVTVTDFSVLPDGTIKYQSKDGKLVIQQTDGKVFASDKSVTELRLIAERIAQAGGLRDIDKTTADLSNSDRLALDELYKGVSSGGISLSEHLRTLAPSDPKAVAALRDLNFAHLRFEINPNDSDFRTIEKVAGLDPKEANPLLEKALNDLREGRLSPREIMIGLEKGLTDANPTFSSLNAKYGVKFELQKDGTRKYYVEGEKGKREPILETRNTNPKDVESELKKWQDAKINELQTKFNVEFSRDGKSDKASGRAVDLRSPRLNELVALQAALERSGPALRTGDGSPLLIQFGVQPAFVTERVPAFLDTKDNGQKAVFFQPQIEKLNFKQIRETALHEIAHNEQSTLLRDNPALLEQFNDAQGFRKVTDAEGTTRWQLKDKNGNYWAWFGQNEADSKGQWVRVNEQNQFLKPKTRPQDKDVVTNNLKEAQKIKTEELRKIAFVRPISEYFVNSSEAGAEALAHFRGTEVERRQLYLESPKLYEAAKKFDQAQLDEDPNYGKNLDGSSKYIRSTEGAIVENTPANRAALIKFEAELALAGSRRHLPGR